MEILILTGTDTCAKVIRKILGMLVRYVSEICFGVTLLYPKTPRHSASLRVTPLAGSHSQLSFISYIIMSIWSKIFKIEIYEKEINGPRR